MKKMSKEELIEYFIELLGDNSVLEKYFTIDEIRNKLTNIIQKVSYEKYEGSTTSGFFDEDIGQVNIDYTKGYTDEQLKETIVHEMLHVLSYSYVESENIRTNKCGLEISQSAFEGTIKNTGIWTMTTDRSTRMFGKSINEGYTQILTERILGIDTDDNEGYEQEKDIVRILEAALGKEYLMDKFFEDIDKEANGSRPVDYLLGKRLQELFDTTQDREVKYNVVEAFCVVFVHLERMAVLKSNVRGDFNKEEQERFNKDVKDLKNMAELFVETLVYRLKDKKDKERIKNIVIALLDEYHGEDFNLHLVDKDILPVLAEFMLKDLDDVPFGEKLQDFMDITQREDYTGEAGIEDEEIKRIIEEDALRRGIIKESELYKGAMLSVILDNYRESLRGLNDEEVAKMLGTFSYIKAGSLYELRYHGIDPNLKGGVEGIIFDSHGERAIDRGGFSYYHGLWKYNAGWKSAKLSEDEIDKIDVALGKLELKGEIGFYEAEIYGDTVLVTYEDGDRIYYELTEEGDLKELPKEERRLTDNVPEENIDRPYSEYLDTFPGEENPYTKSVLKYSLKAAEEDDLNMLIELKRRFDRAEKKEMGKTVIDHIKLVLEEDKPRFEMVKKAVRYMESNPDATTDEFYYERVGDYYKFCYRGEHPTTEMLDENGKRIKFRRLEYYADRDTFDELDIQRFSRQEIERAREFSREHGNKYMTLSFSGPLLVAEGRDETDIFMMTEDNKYEKLEDKKLRRLVEDRVMMMEYAISALGTGIRSEEISYALEEEKKLKDGEIKPEFD